MPDNLPAHANIDLTLSRLAEEYAILNPADAAEVREITRANLGPRGLREGELDRIKVPTGGAQSFVAQGIDGEEMLRQLECICLSWFDRRMFYRVPYEQRGKQRTPPDCSSRDGFIGIGDPGGSCPECPMADWGTDPKGGRGQWCKELRQMLILRSGHILPEIINVPPTSLKNARQYFQRLSSRRIPYWGLVIVLRLERVDNADGVPYARMTFSSGAYLSPAERAALAPFQAEMNQVLRNATVEATDYEVVPEQHGDFMPPPGESAEFSPPTDD
jgi:hypothetical protein